MRADTLLVAVAAAAGSASAKTFRIAASSIDYSWHVTGWSAGCARAGCYYNFNVTGAANDTSRPPVPEFKAYCNGYNEGAPYQLCERIDGEDNNAVVAAKLLDSPIIINGTRPAIIQVSLAYEDPFQAQTWWNFTGHASSFYNQFIAPLQNFTITPDEIFGVA